MSRKQCLFVKHANHPFLAPKILSQLLKITTNTMKIEFFILLPTSPFVENYYLFCFHLKLLKTEHISPFKHRHQTVFV